MTKRQAILAALAGTIGLMSHRAKTEMLQSSGTTNIATLMVPQTVSFSLDTFKEFTFSQGGESVTLTGKEIFAALKTN